MSDPAPAIALHRIRFATPPAVGERLLRVFKSPRPCVAVLESVPLSDLPRSNSWPEPTETLHVVLVPTAAAAEWEKFSENWLAPPNDPEAPQPVTVSRKHGTIHWRPGRAVVQGTVESPDELLAALAEFAFYEGELRTLERLLEAKEADARTDTARAFVIRRKDRAHWARLAETVEFLAQLRITSAALEPRLKRGSRALPQPVRQLVRRLLIASGTNHRLEDLDGRLEVCEEIYEGATDRVADHHGWFSGHILELIIILLLVVEVILMSIEVWWSLSSDE